MEVVYFDFDRNENSEEFSYKIPDNNYSGWLKNIIENEHYILDKINNSTDKELREDDLVLPVVNLAIAGGVKTLVIPRHKNKSKIKNLILDTQQALYYSDVYAKDDDFLFPDDQGTSDRKNIVVFVVLLNKEYYGHIWTWEDNKDNYTNVIGIRTCLKNYYARYFGLPYSSGIGEKLLTSIKDTFRENIKINAPFEHVGKIAKNLGFIKKGKDYIL